MGPSGRIVVERPHYAAAMELLKTVAPGPAAVAVAGERVHECFERDDFPGADFWQGVCDFLRDRAGAGADAEIVIVEEGQGKGRAG